MTEETAWTPRTQDLRREIAALPHFGQHGFSAEAPWEIVFKRFSQLEREVAALTAEREVEQPYRTYLYWKDRAEAAEAELDAAKRARTAQDYAIEHAEYMAKAAERFLEAAEKLLSSRDVDMPELMSDEQADEAYTDQYRTLTGLIYEFRKRARRAAKNTEHGGL